MTDEAMQKRREYQRAWRAANPDKVRANNAHYWERKAAKDRQKAAENCKGGEK